MSRSRKKIPIQGNAGSARSSDKLSKQEANRAERKVIKQMLHEHSDKLEEIELPLKKEISNVWDFNKDGKSFIKNAADEDYRK